MNFLNWNIEGLQSKLEDTDFITSVSKFDFVCLTETFIKDFLSKDPITEHSENQVLDYQSMEDYREES